MRIFFIAVGISVLAGCQTMDNALQSSKDLLGFGDDTEATEEAPVADTTASPAVPKVRPAVASEQDIPLLTPSSFDRDKPLGDYQVADRAYAEETKNFGVPPVSSLLPTNYQAPTPTTVAGGVLITTHDLHRRMIGKNPPIVINSLGGDQTELIPGSIWLSGAGNHGRFSDDISKQLDQRLQELTGGDRSKTIVFYCLDVRCWHSYNASIRATNLGYSKVRWYRGGLKAWHEAGLPHFQSRDDRW